MRFFARHHIRILPTLTLSTLRADVPSAQAGHVGGDDSWDTYGVISDRGTPCRGTEPDKPGTRDDDP